MIKKRRHLGEILYSKGLVDKENLIKAIKKAKESNKRLGEMLIQMGLANEDQVFEALAKQFGMDYVDLDKVEVPENAKQLIPEELIKKHRILPLSKDNGTL